MTRTLLASLSALALLSACGDSSDTTTAEVEPAGVERPAGGEVVEVESPTELELTKPARFTTAADARRAAAAGDREALDAFADMAELSELRDLSNAMWSGQGVERDRAASAILAVEAFEREPQTWSALRAGIAHVNGLGVDSDPARGIDILAHESLATNPAAPYYQSKAYERMGDVDGQRAALRRAADLGNARAKSELDAL